MVHLGSVGRVGLVAAMALVLMLAAPLLRGLAIGSRPSAKAAARDGAPRHRKQVEVRISRYSKDRGLVTDYTRDPNGLARVLNASYMMYEPCYGRYANQLISFEFALWLAKRLDRVLVLPDLYVGESCVKISAFDKLLYLKPGSPLLPRTITMLDFQHYVAPTFKDTDVKFEYGGVKTVRGFSRGDRNMNPLLGDLRIPMVKSQSFLHTKYTDEVQIKKYLGWKERMLGFGVVHLHAGEYMWTDAPPVHNLLNFIQPSEKIEAEVEAFIAAKVKRPFIGLHLRFMEGANHLYAKMKGIQTAECTPAVKTVVASIKALQKNTNIKNVFIGWDGQEKETAQQIIAQVAGVVFVPAVKMVTLNIRGRDVPTSTDYADVAVDIEILRRADHLVGNPCSSIGQNLGWVRWADGKTNSSLHGYMKRTRPRDFMLLDMPKIPGN